MISLDGNGGGVVDLRSTLQCVQGNNPRSISFMIQTTVTTDARILYTGSYGSWIMFGICINVGASGKLTIDSGGGWYISSNGKTINDGLWHTVLVTYDGTTLNIYVDGILDNTATNWNGGSTATIASTLNTIGNSGNYLGQFGEISISRWLGKLKNVLFYDYVVTNSYALATSFQSAGTVLYNSGNYFIQYYMVHNNINVYTYNLLVHYTITVYKQSIR